MSNIEVLCPYCEASWDYVERPQPWGVYVRSCCKCLQVWAEDEEGRLVVKGKPIVLEIFCGAITLGGSHGDCSTEK